MAHTSIAMEDMPIEMLDFTPVNPLISKCLVKVCYVGQEANRNKSIITKEVASEFAASIPGCPIVGYYNEATGDFEEHNKMIDLSNGKFKIKDTTRPYGFVSMDAKVWFQWYEDDGVPHEYLVTEGYVWTGQYPESQRIIEKGNNQSMELDEGTLDAFWTKDSKGKPQFFIINEAIMSKLCILGEDVEPCFEGASIAPIQFSFEDDFKNRLFSFMGKMQEILSNEGGTPVVNAYAVEIGDALWNAIYDYLWMNRRGDELMIFGIYEDGGQKFAILRDRKDLTYYRLNFSVTEENGFTPDGEISKVALDFKPAGEAQFALEAIEAFEAEYAKSKEEPAQEEEEPAVEEDPKAEEVVEEEPVVEEPVQEEPVDEPQVEEEKKAEKPVEEVVEGEEEPVSYNLDEVVEYTELLNKYNELEGKVAELTAQIDTLTAENKTLAEFKLEIDRKNKLALINETFYMLSDDQKKDCLDNIDTYSYDDIEAKLSVICVRNKVNFGLETPEEEKPQTTYNIDSVEETNAGLPAWVMRVMEEQNKL